MLSPTEPGCSQGRCVGAGNGLSVPADGTSSLRAGEFLIFPSTIPSLASFYSHCYSDILLFISRHPTLPSTHTLCFCKNSSLVFFKGGWRGRDCFLKGIRHVQGRSKVLNRHKLAFWEACWWVNKQLNAILLATCLREHLKGKACIIHRGAQRYKITCLSACSKCVHFVLVLFFYIQALSMLFFSPESYFMYLY